MKTVSLRFAGCAALLALGLNAGAKTVEVTGPAELSAAFGSVAAGDVIQITAPGDYAVETLGGSGYTLEATVPGVVLKHTAGYSAWIASCDSLVTVKNLTWDFGNANYQYFKNVKCVDCVLNGQLCSHSENVFEGCTFNQSSPDWYCLWFYGNNGTFTNCTFNAQGKFMNVYCEGNANPYNLVAECCTFNNMKSTANKPPFNIKESCGNAQLKYNITVTGCRLGTGSFPEGGEFDPSQSCYVINSLIQIDDRNTSMAQRGILVTYEGSVVYQDGVAMAPVAKEIEIKPVTKDETKGITEEIAAEINGNVEVRKIVESGVNDALANIDPAGEAVVKVRLEKVETVEETPTLTFEVAPYVGNEPVADVNKKLNGKKVTVVLPLTSAFTVSAKVTHAGDPERLLPVLGLPNSPYVRFETTHFSAFTATPSSERVTTATVEARSVLGIKRVKGMAVNKDTAAAVPWLGAAGGDCTVAELVTTGLAEDDQIMVYDLTAKAYYTWYFTKTKTWEPMTGSGAPAATEYRVERGRAFWYKKDAKNASAEYAQVGTYDADRISTLVDGGQSFAAPEHNLLINPKWEDFAIGDRLTSGIGCRANDSVVIVATEERYYFDGVAWGQYVEVTKKDRRGREVKTTELRRIGDESVTVGDGVVPRGTAFWYLSAGGVPSIAW